jgi:hypothetical protein
MSCEMRMAAVEISDGGTSLDSPSALLLKPGWERRARSWRTPDRPVLSARGARHDSAPCQEAPCRSVPLAATVPCFRGTPVVLSLCPRSWGVSHISEVFTTSANSQGDRPALSRWSGTTSTTMQRRLADWTELTFPLAYRLPHPRHRF